MGLLTRAKNGLDLLCIYSIRPSFFVGYKAVSPAGKLTKEDDVPLAQRETERTCQWLFLGQRKSKAESIPFLPERYRGPTDESAYRALKRIILPAKSS